jgi:hypothetical protein
VPSRSFGTSREYADAERDQHWHAVRFTALWNMRFP